MTTVLIKLWLPFFLKLSLLAKAVTIGSQELLQNDLTSTELRQLFGSAAPPPYHLLTDVTLSERDGQKFLHLKLPRNELPLELRLLPVVDDLLSPNLVSVYRGFNNSRLHVAPYMNKCHFQHRSVNVSAAISTCNDAITGTIVQNGELFVVHPLPLRFTGKLGSKDTHVVYKRETMLPSDSFSSASHNATNLTFCGIAPKIENRARFDDVLASARHKRASVSKFDNDLTVELGVFIDFMLYRRYLDLYGVSADGRLQDFVVTVFNNVQMLYQQPSISPKMSFKIVHYEVFTYQPGELSGPSVGTGYAQGYLDAFCGYQTRRANRNWDHGFLLTGYNLYNQMGDPSISGIARLNGMCFPQNSCTVSEGMDFNAVFIGTHELGHNLGMSHDEPMCSSDYIMSAALGAGKLTWSACSMRDYQSFVNQLDTRWEGNCLRTLSGYDYVRLSADVYPGQKFSADQQCEIMHGAGQRHVVPQNGREDAICQMLWCSAGYGRIITSHPALEGTSCGDGRWCILGRCVVSTQVQQPPPIDGGWSVWTSSSSCSQRCQCAPFANSIGVFLSQRSCNTPYPAHGGKQCSGEETRGIVCANNCGSGTDQLDAYMDRVCTNQKTSRGDLELSGKGEQLRNRNERDRACKVFCVIQSAKGRQYRHYGDFLPDGTACGDTAGDQKYCVSGKCLPKDCNAGGLVATSADCPLNSELCTSRNDVPVGQWQSWASWGTCSKTCGQGSQQRSRTCDGGNCAGSATDTSVCNVQACVGQWSAWQDWSACSLTCGAGTQTRSRTCPSDSTCIGSSTEQNTCQQGFCPWQSWGSCSVTCGGGTRSRTRDCPGNGCPGTGQDTESCNNFPCNSGTPSIAATWGDWSSCSGSLACNGWGQRSRNKTCTTSGNCGDSMSVTQSESCQLPSCDGVDSADGWGSWQKWTDCSTTCGPGRRARYRECKKPATCKGIDREYDDCDNGDCGKLTAWSLWSDCSQSCAGGVRTRARSCDGSPDQCTGPTNERQLCNVQACLVVQRDIPIGSSRNDPTSDSLSEWADWSSCSATCGAGVQRRIRICYGGFCGGDLQEDRSCQTGTDCPSWSDWSTFSPCTTQCGGGQQTRYRTCSTPNGCSGVSVDTKLCNQDPCGPTSGSTGDSFSGTWSDWSAWQTCSQSCGGGVISRYRKCLSWYCQGPAVDQEPCNKDPCASWGGWGEFSECNVPCGGGTMKRIRNCYGLGQCDGVDSEFRICNTHKCKRSFEIANDKHDADNKQNEWSEWTDFSACNSVGCAVGTQSQTRVCYSRSGCLGESRRTRPCRNATCPDALNWNIWESWSPCSKTCGVGEQVRKRNNCLGNICFGSNAERRVCDLKPCDQLWSTWSTWSSCSSTCGEGHRGRSRQCLATYCEGNTEENERCNLEQQCPTWTEFGPWSGCSKPCDSGVRVRRRSCFRIGSNVPEATLFCDGVNSEEEPCNSQPCSALSAPVYHVWGPWGYCSTSCGGTGMRTRIRVCANSKCSERVQEDAESCYQGPCQEKPS